MNVANREADINIFAFLRVKLNRDKFSIRLLWASLLVGVLLVAAGLRLWGIGFGLPYPYHVDEPAYISAALNLGAGIIGRQLNPTGYANILFAEFAAYFLSGRITGAFASRVAFEQAYRLDPTIFFLLGRLTTALFGVLNVLIVYFLGKEVKGRITGLLAAFFLSIAFLHVRDSHYAVPDIMMASLTSLCVLFCVLAVKNPHRWYLNFATATAGFAIATKWSAWPVILTCILAVYYCLKSNPERLEWKTNFRKVIGSVLSFLIGLLLGGFQLVLQPRSYITDALRELRAGGAGGFGIWQIDTVPGWVFYIKTLAYGIGFVLLIIGVIGFFVHSLSALKDRDKVSILLLAFPLPYYLLMGGTPHYFARYALPLVPFLVLFAAEQTVIMAGWIEIRLNKAVGVFFLLFTLLGIAQPLTDSVRSDFLLTRQDTRTLAKYWIEANLPAGTKIAMDWPVHGPPLSTLKKMMPYSTRTYDVTIVGEVGLPNHTVDWYRQNGFDYLITSSFISDIPTVFEQTNAQRRTFYADLDREFELVQEFKPNKGSGEPQFSFDEIYGPYVSLWERDRPGPILKVYQLDAIK